MAKIEFFALNDAKGRVSSAPDDVIAVDFSRYNSITQFYAVVFILQNRAQPGSLTMKEINERCTPISEKRARRQCGRIYAFALLTFGAQSTP